VAQVLEGYSGSDIRLVCKEAAMRPLRRLMKNLDIVNDSDLNGGIKNWHKEADTSKLPPLG
jgi:SpoVK/Ycf46/Vps4 family AAA+-type ATPase